MERSRLFGTAKEAVILALDRHEGFVSTRTILDLACGDPLAASVPAVYRALTVLERHGLVDEGDPDDRRRVITEFARRKASAGSERRLLHYRLTPAGRIMASILVLRRRAAVSPDDLARLAHRFYAHVAGAEPVETEPAAAHRDRRRGDGLAAQGPGGAPDGEP